MNQRGFSLMELIIAMSLMGIVMAISVPLYNKTIAKAKVEKQTKELHSLIVRARLTAMQNKRTGAIYFGPNQCVYRVYTSMNYPAVTAFRSSNTGYSYTLKKKSGSTLVDLDASSDNVEFDTRGNATSPLTLVVTPVTYSGGDDCIVVDTARTNIGRMTDAATCTTR
jgi:prepilin-type N-terminal cleavage/methylation domain-containing protein